MRTLSYLFLATFRSLLRTRAAPDAEILAHCHQITVLQRSARKQARLGALDRQFWVSLSRLWAGWRSAPAKDAPGLRPIQPPELGAVVELPQVGGLHYRYERRAAWNSLIQKLRGVSTKPF